MKLPAHLRFYPDLDTTKYVYVLREETEKDNFTPPTSWRIYDAMGNYMYFRARTRVKAQELCDLLYNHGKYTVMPDKAAQIR